MNRSHFAVMLVITATASLMAIGESHAASFDCHETTRPIDKTICDDPTLNSLDSQLDAAYLGAIDRSNDPPHVKEIQRSWLKDRDACADAKCMAAAYSKQIRLLSAISDQPPICNGPSTPEVDACAREYFRRADLELARYVAAVRKRLKSEAEEDTNDEFATKALAQFEVSQVAWESYRKAECDAYYEWWSGGTIRGFMGESCMTSITKARSLAIWETWLHFMDHTPPLLPKPTEK
jgi:uncharacterized protein